MWAALTPVTVSQLYTSGLPKLVSTRFLAFSANAPQQILSGNCFHLKCMYITPAVRFSFDIEINRTELEAAVALCPLLAPTPTHQKDAVLFESRLLVTFTWALIILTQLPGPLLLPGMRRKARVS